MLYPNTFKRRIKNVNTSYKADIFLATVNPKVTFSHTASMKGHISRCNDYCELYEYNGRYGKGYVLLTSRKDSCQYVDVSYYIENN